VRRYLNIIFLSILLILCVTPQQVSADGITDVLFPFLKPPAGADYKVDGNRVYVDNDDVRIEAYPHTLTSSGWVEVKFWTKKYQGDLDICYGFNGLDNVQAMETQVYDDDKADWVKNEVQLASEWKSYKGSDKWQSHNLVSAKKNTVYTARVWIDIPFNGLNKVEGKYSIGIKPAGSSIDKGWILDPWYSSSWGYRSSVPITGSTAGAQTDYQMKTILMYGTGSSNSTHLYLQNHAQADFDDIRFTSSDGTTLCSYLIESKTDSSTATVWVKIPSIPASPSTTTLYCYYGNSSASSASNGNNTFVKFDDFEWGSDGTALNTSGGGITWSTSDAGSSKTEIDTAQYYTGTRSARMYRDGTNSIYALLSYTAGTGYAIRWNARRDGNARMMLFHGNSAYRMDIRINTDETVSFGTSSSGYSAAANAWHLMEINNFNWSTGKFDAYLNGTKIGNQVSAVSDAGYNGVIQFWNDNGTGENWIDNFIIRKWCSPEPTWGTWSSEDSYLNNCPSVTTNDAINVEETTATLNATINSASSQTLRGFAWGATSNSTLPINGVPPASYSTNWTQLSSDIGNFTHDITGLTSGDAYYFRGYSYNATGYGWGGEKSFLTKPTEPLSFNATGSDSAVSLAWTKPACGTGTTVNTVIRYKQGSYPANITDGTLSYNSTSTSTAQGGLTNGLEYYFRAWTFAYDGSLSQYSDTYADCTATPWNNTVTTREVTGFGQTWAILNGALNTLTDTATQTGFDYGLTSSYTDSATQTGTYSTGNFHYTLTGLSTGTVYHYRAKALVGGSWLYGEDRVFSTKGSPVTYEYNNTGGNTDSFKINSANWTYQTFTTNTTSVSHSITSFKLKLKRVGSPGTIIASIKNTANATSGQTCYSYPTGEDVITAYYDGDTVDLAYAWYEFIPDVETCLSANTTYAIAVRALSGDANNYIMWQTQTTGTYTGGNAGYSVDSGVVWENSCPKDQLFEVWGNPCLDVLDAKVITGYLETGDWLVCVLYKNFFQPYYLQAQDVQSLFYLQLVDSTGTVRASTLLPEWGYRPACIYISADDTVQLEWGQTYTVRIYGNFTGYPYAEYSIQTSDWLGSDLTRLDAWVRTAASLMEDYYNATYTEYVAGKGLVLNETGGVIFSNNIPELDTIRPDIFKVTTSTIGKESGTYTHGLQSDLVWQTMWGTQMTRMFTLVGNAANLDPPVIGMIIGFIMYALTALFCFAPGHAIAAIVIPIPILIILWGTGLAELALLGILLAVTVVLWAWQLWFKSR